MRTRRDVFQSSRRRRGNVDLRLFSQTCWSGSYQLLLITVDVMTRLSWPAYWWTRHVSAACSFYWLIYIQDICDDHHSCLKILFSIINLWYVSSKPKAVHFYYKTKVTYFCFFHKLCIEWQLTNKFMFYKFLEFQIKPSNCAYSDMKGLVWCAAPGAVLII